MYNLIECKDSGKGGEYKENASFLSKNNPSIICGFLDGWPVVRKFVNFAVVVEALLQQLLRLFYHGC